MEHEQKAVSVQHVSKSFNGRRVLEDLSFDVQPGEAFCLLGRSGIGKSVTLKLLIRLLTPDSGDIFINGKNLANLEPAGLGELRKQVGFLFQDGALFDSISVGET